MSIQGHDWPCVLCGTSPCVTSCPSQEWPPKLTPSLLFTRILIGLAVSGAALSFLMKPGPWSAIVGLFALGCGVGACIVDLLRK